MSNRDDAGSGSDREKDMPAIKGDVQVKLGEKLREVYADVVNEPVPDRFVDLLKQLEESGSKKTD